MNQPIRIFAMLCLSGVPVHGADAPAVAVAGKPNILLVIADRWRAQAFGYAGDPNARTPHLDALEKESVHCTNAISGVPVCSPARASLMTSQRPLTHGLFLNDVPLNPTTNSIAHVLGRAGYDTGCIGKWHIDGHGRSAFIPRERRQGFDYWKVLECPHNYNHSFYYADGPEKFQWNGYDAVAQTKDAQQYLRNHAMSDNGKPFFLYLSWGPPHEPYEGALEKYQAMYHPDQIQLRPNVPESAAPKARKELAGYYAHCSALDDCMEVLLDTLRETDMR